VTALDTMRDEASGAQWTDDDRGSHGAAAVAGRARAGFCALTPVATAVIRLTDNDFASDLPRWAAGLIGGVLRAGAAMMAVGMRSKAGRRGWRWIGFGTLAAAPGVALLMRMHQFTGR
jgi:hypothetical protein